ncbi:hypothetical protein PsorP6_017475 [Peronosclerospora sorghi]|uniref:Uncharacterized protein n=1 Tax=Peronosclerospora sorghi TaxID=230839 RepID=A0ACC0WLK8_9STRA|nr:hypothetical protein PsorP6_017475 [Peronosclerospora sorghi]
MLNITQDADRCIPMKLAWLFQVLRKHRKGHTDVCKSSVGHIEECTYQLPVSRLVIESCMPIT